MVTILGNRKGVIPCRVYGMGCQSNSTLGLLWNLKKAAENNPKQVMQ